MKKNQTKKCKHAYFKHFLTGTVYTNFKKYVKTCGFGKIATYGPESDCEYQYKFSR